ncbi:unnamed protein product [Arabidopsis thaliana]|uniref:Gb/AAD48962.1 n=1 Tax=Arabidopsis thaliana TaxID=3702 RepID=Q9LIJ3_ARATH|nr:unnamed protein product [Arabidopsis thaliana]
MKEESSLFATYKENIRQSSYHHFSSPSLDHHSITSLDPEVECLHPIARPVLDLIILPGSRVSPSPPLECILDDKLQSLLHSALNQTLEHKEEKKTPAIHSTSHSTTWVEYSS